MRELLARNGAAADGFGALCGVPVDDRNLFAQPRQIDVLVVEDNEADFQALCDALDAMGTFRAEVHRAANPIDAGSLAERRRFDVALVAHTSGMETDIVRHSGSHGGAFAVILVTDLPGQDVPQAAISAGAIHCLDKSNLSVGLLETTIRSALYSHSLEMRLQQTTMDLERANVAKASFFERLGHDLRTPLDVILANAGAVAHPVNGAPVSPEQERYADNIRMAAHHLLEVFDNLIFHSGGSNQELKDCRETVDAGLLVHRAIDMIELAAQERNHEIIVAEAENGALVNCLSSVLIQAIINVLSNAVKYTPDGGTINVSVNQTDRWTEICVSDNGIGMSRDDVCVALLPYGRVEQPPGLAQEGTGIGLPVVRDIMKSHGGQLEIDSARERGTTITLRLPLIERDQFAA